MNGSQGQKYKSFLPNLPGRGRENILLKCSPLNVQFFKHPFYNFPLKISQNTIQEQINYVLRVQVYWVVECKSLVTEHAFLKPLKLGPELLI